jgi:hypothetical protein
MIRASSRRARLPRGKQSQSCWKWDPAPQQPHLLQGTKLVSSTVSISASSIWAVFVLTFVDFCFGACFFPSLSSIRCPSRSSMRFPSLSSIDLPSLLSIPVFLPSLDSIPLPSRDSMPLPGLPLSLECLLSIKSEIPLLNWPLVLFERYCYTVDGRISHSEQRSVSSTCSFKVQYSFTC